MVRFFGRCFIQFLRLSPNPQIHRKLRKAIEDGDLEATRALFTPGLQLPACTMVRISFTAWSSAASFLLFLIAARNISNLQDLLDKKISAPPLHIAARAGNLKLCRFLIEEAHADTNETTEQVRKAPPSSFPCHEVGRADRA